MVNPGHKVTLDGSKSRDPDGSIASYLWKQIPGASPIVSLYGSDTVNPSFIAPSVKSDAKLAFTLTVKDDKGASSTANVHVMVKAPSIVTLQPPKALNGSATTQINEDY